jgi:hypothetical protein
MTTSKISLLRSPLSSVASGVLGAFVLFLVYSAVAESLAPIVQTGFAAWAKSGADLALDAWQKGGLLEGDNKVAGQSGYFRRLDRLVGNFLSYETLETKSVGQNSQILYLSINFQRGAVYARFHLYRSDKGWVVQNMDFSTRPEALMPWLAFAGTNYGE